MPIKKSASQATLAYSQLKQMITSGSFGPEDRLREIDISERLGMSRTPVREALKRLEDEGLLTHEPRKGLVITTLDQQAITQLYSLREILEGGAAGLAARHASDAEIDYMRAILHDSKSGKDPVKSNYDFHQTIYQASHNQFLVKSIHNLIDSTALLGQSTLAHTGRPQIAYQEHMKVFEAIAARDAEAAEKAARSHIRQALLARLKLHGAGSSSA
ncbi:GntR family transcriptional regulator [Allopusillimonas soli]|uniref:GntR family transcriptional regulator n=1 Tax=Allopusillimonas soli TaxID=659016 RepID=A0A853FG41_9BURK|nr:GntR family transcriptional regulator [Allopusillimonas soli]NYT37451.1 GntR family transcriptional regulator [Allopusillimonas soli]TEA74568.1 GntR family transcriptional regulator [Allopusillimonas soli]